VSALASPALAKVAVLAAAPVAGLALSVSVAVNPVPVAVNPVPVAVNPAASGHTVLVGIPGLRWSDVSANETPALWQLADDGALAAMSVRTVRPASCPADGWLTVNSGARSIMPRTGDAARPCVTPPEPLEDPTEGFAVRGWSAVLDHNREFSYDPRFGLLAEAAAQRGCATAVGPGAALALADGNGRLERYAPTVAEADLDACPLTVIDPGALLAPYTPDRETTVHRLDADLSGVLAQLPSDATLFVAGLADSVLVPTHLSVMLANGGPYQRGWLTTRSTRHDGLAQVTDLTPTLLAAMGVDTPPGAVGAPMTHVGGRPDVSEAVDRLVDRDRAAQTIRESFSAFFAILVLGQLLAYLLVALIRRGASSRGHRWLGTVEAVALGFAAAPAASFLANLLPWWRTERPGLALWAAVVACCALVAALAYFLPWGPRITGSAGFVAAVTAAVLAVDVVIGSPLQLSSLYGLSPLIAGRFYGFGNIAFAVFAMSALLAATWAASVLLRRARPAVAALAVAVIGTVAVVIDGWPTFGADFGGVLALVPGFTLLTLGVAGAGFSARRVAAATVAAVGAVSAIAVLDWTRPAGERSHLGRFVQQVIDGDAGAVLTRKIEANLSSLHNHPELLVLVLVAAVLLTAIVVRPDRLGVRALTQAYAEEPALKPGLVACLVTALLGFAVNDSGVIVPAVALAVAAPLGVAVWAAAASTPRSRRSAAQPPPPAPARHARSAARRGPGPPVGR